MCKKFFPSSSSLCSFSCFSALSVAQPSAPFSATLVDFEGRFLSRKRENLWLPVEKDIPLEQGDT